jgi:hypothetical protein
VTRSEYGARGKLIHNRAYVIHNGKVRARVASPDAVGLADFAVERDRKQRARVSAT